MFTQLTIDGWRQFRSISIDLHPRLTIITGANGAGKSTLLNIFTMHFGYNRALFATPIKKNGVLSFSAGVFRWLRNKKRAEEHPHYGKAIGSITYSSGIKAPVRVPFNQGLHYNISIDNQQPIVGLHIDSHRPPSIYRHIHQIPASPPNVEAIHNSINGEAMSYFSSGNVHQGNLHYIKSYLIQMSIFGYGNNTMTPNQSLIDLYHGFENKLREVLPESLGFRRLIIESPEVLLDTSSGRFIMDAASGGVIKLIEITWQIYFFSQGKDRFVVTFDEPENHLHPSMQKAFLPKLMGAFPNAQMIVVTHSPFVISAIRESQVYALRYDDATEIEADDDESILGMKGSKVFSEHLDAVNKAGTASEILRDVLGITTTLPDWAEDRVRAIASQYRGRVMNNEILHEISQTMASEGLASSYPAVLEHLVKQ